MLDPNRKRNIVVIDDIERELDATCNLLGAIGDQVGTPFNIMRFESTNRAFEHVMLHSDSIDAIVTDHHMPAEDMSGVDLCRRLEDNRLKIPCVVVTGLSTTAFSRRQAYEVKDISNIVEMLSKPLEPDDLREAALRALNPLRVAWIGVGNVSSHGALLAANDSAFGEQLMFTNIFSNYVDLADGLSSYKRGLRKFEEIKTGMLIRGRPHLASPILFPTDLRELKKYGVHVVVYTLKTRSVNYYKEKRQGASAAEIRRATLAEDIPSVARFAHEIYTLLGDEQPMPAVVSNPQLEILHTIRRCGKVYGVGITTDEERTEELMLELVGKRMPMHRNVDVRVVGLHDGYAAIPDFEAAVFHDGRGDTIRFKDTKWYKPEILRKLFVDLQKKGPGLIQASGETSTRSTAQKTYEFLRKYREARVFGETRTGKRVESYTVWCKLPRTRKRGYLLVPVSFHGPGSLEICPHTDKLSEDVYRNRKWRMTPKKKGKGKRAKRGRYITVPNIIEATRNRVNETNDLIPKKYLSDA